MAEPIRVVDLWVSAATAEKIMREHGITKDEVGDAIVLVPGLRAKWKTDPERGRRAFLETFIRGRRVLVILYPRIRDAYGDAWDLGSVYPIAD